MNFLRKVVVIALSLSYIVAVGMVFALLGIIGLSLIRYALTGSYEILFFVTFQRWGAVFVVFFGVTYIPVLLQERDNNKRAS